MEGVPFVFTEVEVYEYDGVFAVIANDRRILDLTRDGAIDLISKLQQSISER